MAGDTAVRHRPPVLVNPTSQPEKSSEEAVVIFIHGFGSQGVDFQTIGQRAQAAGRLRHVLWVFPSAAEDPRMNKPAWSTLDGIVPGTANVQDQDGILLSMKYITSIVDEQVTRGMNPSRIVVAGFSQGSAVSLLVGLVSKYAGKLAGIGCIAGYFPLSDQIRQLQGEMNCPQVKNKPFLIMRGSNDNVIPEHFQTLHHLEALGYAELVESKEYELDHNLSDEVVDDFHTWLEKVLPQ